jgi:hypothetical protein
MERAGVAEMRSVLSQVSEARPGGLGSRKRNRRSFDSLRCASVAQDDSLCAAMSVRIASYSAAMASAWLGNSPAYLVMPTMVNTLTKCGERP